MSQPLKCNVLWNSFKNYICHGFSLLQQNEEFVDMTLAADGKLIKAHQNIIAVASPYLKALLKSASCTHPVIFLNNVSHRMLVYILDYIYKGEVLVPEQDLDSFLNVANDLKITGIYSFLNDNDADIEEPATVQETDNSGATHGESVMSTNSKDIIEKTEIERNERRNDPNVTDVRMDLDHSNPNPAGNEVSVEKPENNSRKDKDEVIQYTITTRGSVQMLCNDYMYYLHHTSNAGFKCRWRCVDYRHLRCPAYIDCVNGILVTRNHYHCHSNHSKKIKQKIDADLVRGTLQEVDNMKKNLSNLLLSMENVDDYEDMG